MAKQQISHATNGLLIIGGVFLLFLISLAATLLSKESMSGFGFATIFIFYVIPGFIIGAILLIISLFKNAKSYKQTGHLAESENTPGNRVVAKFFFILVIWILLPKSFFIWFAKSSGRPDFCYLAHTSYREECLKIIGW